ncbi:E3 ubiquitin-protein ligase RFWD3-like isoform X2 [Punica granatum]|uniref:RING-type E3 ubiquitin transferase n=1 Tax=Punica granatum TaxID=22663 RepID=A0A6P8DFV4_PUNGR|nr:E3 ubiquitin-protein ligase RFWD3-like isoform X2 [Punica granatum]
MYAGWKKKECEWKNKEVESESKIQKLQQKVSQLKEAAAWSCSWDFHRSHYIYAGLQNGTLMVFDMCQTVKPVESLNGLSSNPIHTILSFSQKNTNRPRPVLTASSIGLSLWNDDCREERPTLVPESADEGVCISLACSPNGDDIVATYRPKIDMSTEVTPTQPSANSSPISGQVTQGSHVLFKRAAGSNFLQKSGSMYANVSDIHLPRSAIVGSENQNRFFAFGDEATNEVTLQGLPSFSTSQRFKLKKHPLRDIKYTVAMNRGLITCLSDDILQVFSRRQG